MQPRRPLQLLTAAVLASGAAAGLWAPPVAHAAPPGDAERGRSLLLQRFETGCILCHQVPGLRAGGDLGPPLLALGQRFSAEQLRDRIADARRYNPQTIMPPYFSTQGLQRVAPAYQGQTVLSEQALEDIVAYLLNPAAPAAAPAAAATTKETRASTP